MSSAGVKEVGGEAKPEIADSQKAKSGQLDHFVFSENAKKLAMATEQSDPAAATSKQERIASIKAQIEAGTYQINSRGIAEGMLKEALAFGKK